MSKPIVGIVMGSDSDLETMTKCAEQLAAFDALARSP